MARSFLYDCPRCSTLVTTTTCIAFRSIRTVVNDPDVGAVELSGRLHEASSDTLLVVVHGLGGDVESHYVLDAANAGEKAGVAVLRVHLRGADQTGADLYHAGMSHDIHAILKSDALQKYARIVLLGYSLGGHIVLRAATEKELDPRVVSVAAICPPLDLRRGVEAIDAPIRLAYRRHVLESIKNVYASVARRRALHLPLAEVRRIRTIRQWDEQVIAPRFGFRGADHYYAEASVCTRLAQLCVPSLLIVARHDPMVPEETVAPALEKPAPLLDVRWMDRGGHVGFPRTSISAKANLDRWNRKLSRGYFIETNPRRRHLERGAGREVLSCCRVKVPKIWCGIFTFGRVKMSDPGARYDGRPGIRVSRLVTKRGF